MSDRNTIAQELTVEQLGQFIDELVKVPGKQRTLAAIKHKAAELGITISLMSAKAFRDTTFERHLAKIRAAQSIAAEVEAIEQGGNTLADASAKILSKRIFSKLLEAEDEDSVVEVDEEKMSLALSRIRSGDVARAALEQKLREYEREAAERAEKKREITKSLVKAERKGGITKETRETIEQELGLL